MSPLANPPAADLTDGRTRHYGAFYGVDEIVHDDRPLVLVVGNCQTEALRVLLDGSPSQAVRTVRMPPIFELTQDDLAHLGPLISRVDVLVVQPVKDDYRGLPLGSAQLVAQLRDDARVVRIPSVFWSGLYPWQLLVRTEESGDPPVVPYHDLRTVLEVATGHRPTAPMRVDGIRELADASVAELRRREDEGETLRASDLLVPAGSDACHVLNHPGNTVLLGLARRVQEAIGLPADAEEPGRVLLSEVVAPLAPEVCEALDLDVAPRPSWLLRGEPLDDGEVREAQLAWLRDHPEIVDLALERHTRTAQLLGWA